jgi:hypothetical protein
MATNQPANASVEDEPAIRHLSSVIRHLSSAICHPPSVIRHPPSAIRHLPFVICHLSFPIPHSAFPGETGEPLARVRDGVRRCQERLGPG